MKYFFDRKTDSLYLTLAERPYADSAEAAPGVVLDFDKAGRLIGIDLERASTIVDVTDLALHEQPVGADVEVAVIDGKTLKREREELGFSQVELGRKLAVSANTIARWERGELRIEHPSMLELALRALRSAQGATNEQHAIKSRASNKVLKGTIKQGRSIKNKKRESSALMGSRTKKKHAG